MSRSYHGKGRAVLVMPLAAVTIQNIADRLECAAEQFTLERQQVCICSNTSPIPRKSTTSASCIKYKCPKADEFPQENYMLDQPF
jgi:hypothetical protein